MPRRQVVPCRCVTVLVFSEFIHPAQMQRKTMRDYVANDWESLAAANGLDSFESVWSLDIGWFEEPNVRFEDGQAIWMAMNDCRKAKPVRGKVADFADALIVHKAKTIATSLNTSFDGSYTFDKAAQVLPGAKALI